MENRKYNSMNFIYGSAAPKREYEPVREPRREEKRRQDVRRNVATREVKTPKIGGVFTAFIAGAVAVTLGACVMYINNINTQSEQAKEIRALEAQLAEMKEANDNKQIAIDTSVDFNYIYNVAVKELGMVHASKDQIISYESGESEFVIQYSDVPVK